MHKSYNHIENLEWHSSGIKIAIAVLVLCTFSINSRAQNIPLLNQNSVAIPSNPIPLATVPTPESIKNGLERLHLVQAPNVVATPPASSPQISPSPVPIPTRSPRQATGCLPSGDIAMLLSPACLEALRIPLSPNGPRLPPTSLSVPPAIPVVSGSMQCVVAVFASERASNSMVSFQASSLAHCIEVGARVSYGVIGESNIIASESNFGVVSVHCHREAPDGKKISCGAQPPIQSLRTNVEVASPAAAISTPPVPTSLVPTSSVPTPALIPPVPTTPPVSTSNAVQPGLTRSFTGAIITPAPVPTPYLSRAQHR